MNLKFLRYDPTPGEKHLGIATIRLEEEVKLIFRFKIVPKDGGGYYCQPASHKISSHGKDNYYPAFAFDSSYDGDCVKEFVLAHVDPIINQTQQQSVFNAPPAQVARPAPQPNPNYGGYQQQPPVQQQQYRQDRPQQQQSYSNDPEGQLPF